MFDKAEDGKCVLCDRVFATVGLVLGLVVIYVSLDIMLDGRLTRSISKPSNWALATEEVDDSE